MEGGEGGLAIHGGVLLAENEMLFDDELGNDQESEEKNEDDSFGTFHDEDVETCYDGLTFADDGSIRSFYNETDENDSLLLDDFDDSASLDTYDTANTTTSRRKNNINNSSVSNSESSTSNTQQQKQRRQQQQKQSRRQTRQHWVGAASRSRAQALCASWPRAPSPSLLCISRAVRHSSRLWL